MTITCLKLVVLVQYFRWVLIFKSPQVNEVPEPDCNMVGKGVEVEGGEVAS